MTRRGDRLASSRSLTPAGRRSPHARSRPQRRTPGRQGRRHAPGRVVLEHLLGGPAGGELAQHHADRDAQVSDAGHTPHSLRVDRDPLEGHPPIVRVSCVPGGRCPTAPTHRRVVRRCTAALVDVRLKGRPRGAHERWTGDACGGHGVGRIPRRVPLDPPGPPWTRRLPRRVRALRVLLIDVVRRFGALRLGLNRRAHGHALLLLHYVTSESR